MIDDEQWRPRIVVCGSGFGRIYLAALQRPGMPFRLAGLLANGSPRSRTVADRHGIPLWTDPDQVPADVELACVVVPGATNGGDGAALACRLMSRGIHVLHEHPLHHGELADCLRQARRSGVVHMVTTNYVHLDAVRTFVAAAGRLLDRQPAVLVDVMTGIQVLYTVIDILGRAMGTLRPWSLTAGAGPGRPVLHSIEGTFAGVPATMRVQNQMRPGDRDNGVHVPHRITLVTEGGSLLLADSSGPVVWAPRLHMPADYATAVSVADCAPGDLDLPAAVCLTPPAQPTHREVLVQQWPAAAERALRRFRDAVGSTTDPLADGQYHLGIARLVADLTRRLGPPQLMSGPAPDIAGATAAVMAGATSAGRPVAGAARS